MLAKRITPKIVLLGLTLQVGIWLGAQLPILFGGAPPLSYMEDYVQRAASGLAFALALALNVEIATEYRHNFWLRLAWLALGANAGFSVLREMIASPLFSLVQQGYAGSPLQGLHHQIMIASANSFLVLGLLGMWWAYHQVGIGFRIKSRDYAAIAGIFLLTCALLYSRQGMSEAASPYFFSRLLQPLGLMLLSMAAAASVVLYRMAIQMNGGKLAIALRCLTFYTLLRGTLVLLEALLSIGLPGWRQSHGHLYFLDLLCWQAVAWLAALAAAYRADLTVHAHKELERQRAITALPISS